MNLPSGKGVIALKEKGVIKKFTVIIEPSKVGFNTVAIVSVDVEPPKLLEAAQKLCDIPETRYVATSTGDHMIMTEIWARDGKELSKIISEKIGKIDGVNKICPAIILENLKFDPAKAHNLTHCRNQHDYAKTNIAKHFAKLKTLKVS